ncbi:hypothetical protein [Pseudomonas sp.]|uniref:hypothetical protein n=1 Tax=Pseudomonas sp. TaxID=306 RepID=UPI00272F7D37|nr:hypothetical protein [Pseudomonas sp.]MDP2244731.1 hypothetical protein [Pseudomonas sp.]
MELLARSKFVIALGKRIAASLAEDEDLVSEWMAHLIAERIDAVEQAPPEDKAAAEEACVQEILRLWSHRYAAPHRMNPLKDIEPIARALGALDPESTAYRYNPDALGLANDEDCKNPNDWLKLALQVDRVSKDLIHFSLQKGAQEALASTEFQTALGEAVNGNADTALEVRLASFLLDIGETKAQLARAGEKIYRERIAHLERFASLAMLLAEQLKQGLREPSDVSQNDDTPN